MTDINLVICLMITPYKIPLHTHTTSNEHTHELHQAVITIFINTINNTEVYPDDDHMSHNVRLFQHDAPYIPATNHVARVMPRERVVVCQSMGSLSLTNSMIVVARRMTPSIYMGLWSVDEKLPLRCSVVSDDWLLLLELLHHYRTAFLFRIGRQSN